MLAEMRDALGPLTTICVAAALFATTAAAALTAPDVELLRPAPGEALAGGSEAIVEWRPNGPLDPTIVEWEAFLSFNGGEYYAVRITPHLDLSRRRFAFTVPALPTAEARILLRFGDEEHEVGVEVPRLFSVLPESLPRAARALPALDRGEPARPGEPGVVAWVEGTRQGQGLARFESSPPRCKGATVSAGLAEPGTVLTPRNESPTLAPAAGRIPAARPPPPPEAEDRPRPPAPILLLGCRQNE